MALTYLRQQHHFPFPLKRAFGKRRSPQSGAVLSPATEKQQVEDIIPKILSSITTSDAKDEEDAVPEGMMRIPDLFVSWAAQKARVNPFYEEVKPEVEEWFKVYDLKPVLELAMFFPFLFRG